MFWSCHWVVSTYPGMWFSVFPFAAYLSLNVPTTQNSHHPAILPILIKTTNYTEDSLFDPPINPTEPVVYSPSVSNDL
jgi:hypothetical protein